MSTPKNMSDSKVKNTDNSTNSAIKPVSKASKFLKKKKKNPTSPKAESTENTPVTDATTPNVKVEDTLSDHDDDAEECPTETETDTILKTKKYTDPKSSFERLSALSSELQNELKTNEIQQSFYCFVTEVMNRSKKETDKIKKYWMQIVFCICTLFSRKHLPKYRTMKILTNTKHLSSILEKMSYYCTTIVIDYFQTKGDITYTKLKQLNATSGSVEYVNDLERRYASYSDMYHKFVDLLKLCTGTWLKAKNVNIVQQLLCPDIEPDRFGMAQSAKSYQPMQSMQSQFRQTQPVQTQPVQTQPMQMHLQPRQTHPKQTFEYFDQESIYERFFEWQYAIQKPTSKL